MSYPFPRFPRKVSASGLKVQDVFAATTFTADGNPRTITTNVDLLTYGGMAWFKNRTNVDTSVDSHYILDTGRGLGTSTAYYLKSDATSAQVAQSSLFSLSTTGISLTSTGGAYDGYTNNAGSTEVLWSFRKAAKFFDVVTWVGDGTDNRAISHSLGVAPGMIIVQNATSGGNWRTYHVGIGTGHFLNLNGTSAIFTNADAFPSVTNSQFIVSANQVGFSSGNNSGATYVAYLFAHDPDTSNGIIQCGSFTTDGSGNATVTLGWEPQWILYKRTDAASDWAIIDQTRGWTSGSESRLFPNLSSAEDSIAGFITPSSTGFSVAGLIGASHPAIYTAIRKGPM